VRTEEDDHNILRLRMQRVVDLSSDRSRVDKAAYKVALPRLVVGEAAQVAESIRLGLRGNVRAPAVHAAEALEHAFHHRVAHEKQA